MFEPNKFGGVGKKSVPLPCCIRNFGVCTDATTGIERRRRRARALEGSRSEKNGEFWMTKTIFTLKKSCRLSRFRDCHVPLLLKFDIELV